MFNVKDTEGRAQLIYAPVVVGGQGRKLHWGSRGNCLG